MKDYPERPECDFSRPGAIIALTQCETCSQTIPQNFAYKGKYMSDEEHFCSSACQQAFEEEFKPLPMMREAGL